MGARWKYDNHLSYMLIYFFETLIVAHLSKVPPRKLSFYSLSLRALMLVPLSHDPASPPLNQLVLILVLVEPQLLA
jgi:hypothetical protein